MGNLHSARRLLTNFRNRSVVFSTRTLLNEKKTLIISFEIEFGKGGTIGFRSVIDLSAANRELTVQEYDQLYTQSQRKLVAHQKSVEGFIRVFDETIAWAKQPTRSFNLSSNVGHNPFFIHGSQSTKEIRLEFFGRGINDVVIGFDHSKGTLTDDAFTRLNDLRDCLIEHQDSVNELSIYKMLSSKQ